MNTKRTALVATMGALAPLMSELDAGLRARGFSPLYWAMGGGDGGLDLLRAEGLSAYAPLRDDQILHHLDLLPENGCAQDHPRMEFYRAFERGSLSEARIGEEGLRLIARWAEHIRGRAAQLMDRLQPSVILVQSGIRLVEGSLADLARERELPMLLFEKGAFPGTILVDERGVGPLSLYGDRDRWEAAGSKTLTPKAKDSLERFRRRFRSARNSAWEQPASKAGDLRAQLHLAPGRRILFIPGQVRHDANTVLYSPRFDGNESFLRFMLEATRSSDLFILAKPHPRESRDESGMAKLLKGRGVWMPELHVHDALEAAELVACLNSTLGLEALIYGKPVISGARAFWAGKGFSFDLLDDPLPESLRAFLAEAPAPDPARLDPFLHHLLTRGTYGSPADPWPGMDALAARLALMADERPGDAGTGRLWMEGAEAEALRREREVHPPGRWESLLPFFD